MATKHVKRIKTLKALQAFWSDYCPNRLSVALTLTILSGLLLLMAAARQRKFHRRKASG